MTTYNYREQDFNEDAFRHTLESAGLDSELLQDLILTFELGGISLLHPLLEFALPPADDNLEKWVEILNQRYRGIRSVLATKPPPDGLALYTSPFRLPVVINWWRSEMVPVGPGLRVALSLAWRLFEGDDTLEGPWIPDVIECFRACGFTTDKPGVQAPKEPLKVYRGGLPNGIAWSTEFSVAKWFADRHAGGGIEAEPIFEAIAPPEAILAQLRGREEFEVVVEPGLLQDVHRANVDGDRY